MHLLDASAGGRWKEGVSAGVQAETSFNSRWGLWREAESEGGMEGGENNIFISQKS